MPKRKSKTEAVVSPEEDAEHKQNETASTLDRNTKLDRFCEGVVQFNVYAAVYFCHICTIAKTELSVDGERYSFLDVLLHVLRIASMNKKVNGKVYDRIVAKAKQHETIDEVFATVYGALATAMTLHEAERAVEGLYVVFDCYNESVPHHRFDTYDWTKQIEMGNSIIYRYREDLKSCFDVLKSVDSILVQPCAHAVLAPVQLQIESESLQKTMVRVELSCTAQQERSINAIKGRSVEQSNDGAADWTRAMQTRKVFCSVPLNTSTVCSMLKDFAMEARLDDLLNDFKVVPEKKK